MIGSLYTGSSGVKTYSKAMTVVGSNIANVNTTGYKSSRAGFEDMIASSIAGTGSKIGKGVNLASVKTIHSQGTFENSELETDMAIDGDGFFVVEDQFGKEFYTRAGDFKFDKDGYLTTKKGLHLQMNEVSQLTGEVMGAPKKMKILGMVDPPAATSDGVAENSGIMISANLDADAKVPEIEFNPDNVQDSMYNFSTAVTVYDQLGNEHTTTVAFRKMQDQPPQVNPATGQPIPNTEIKNAWEWYAIMPGEEIEGGQPGAMQAIGGGFMQFTDDGRLLETVGAELRQAPPAQPGGAPGAKQLIPVPRSAENPVPQIAYQFRGMDTPQIIGFNFGEGSNPNDPIDKRDGLDGITQFAAENKIHTISADGNKSGSLESVRVDASGIIEGVFDSGVVRPLSRLAIAKFASTEELSKKGDNLFTESLKSGKPVVGNPGVGGLGVVRSKSLEKSNVDLAGEFVKMIENQRAFQSNAKTVTTSDEMVADLIQMKR